MQWFYFAFLFIFKNSDHFYGRWSTCQGGDSKVVQRRQMS